MIEHWVEAVDELRQPLEDDADNWKPWIKVWAQVEDLGGAEYHLAKQVEAGKVTTRVVIRWRDDIDRATMRVNDAGRILGIESVLDREGRRRKLELMCKEVDDGRAT
jgi:SPP1 family predicted phage head-tail adaptor